MTEKAKSWALVLLIGLVAILVLPQLLKELIPNLFESVDVPSDGRSTDIDFPVVIRIKGGMLEVASIKGSRNFPKSTDPNILGKAIPYCRERASWSAPYQITYRIRLGGAWHLRYYKGTLIAQVPEMEPALPVAFDTTGLRKGAEESCWFFPDQGTRDRALSSISPELAKIAKSEKSKDFAREKARKTVVEFLRTWTLRQQTYADLPPNSKIEVYFPGE